MHGPAVNLFELRTNNYRHDSMSVLFEGTKGIKVALFFFRKSFLFVAPVIIISVIWSPAWAQQCIYLSLCSKVGQVPMAALRWRDSEGVLFLEVGSPRTSASFLFMFMYSHPYPTVSLDSLLP